MCDRFIKVFMLQKYYSSYNDANLQEPLQDNSKKHQGTETRITHVQRCFSLGCYFKRLTLIVCSGIEHFGTVGEGERDENVFLITHKDAFVLLSGPCVTQWSRLRYSVRAILIRLIM